MKGKVGPSTGQAAEVVLRGKRLRVRLPFREPFWVALLPWNIVSREKRKEEGHGVYLAQERKQERKTTRRPKRLRGGARIKEWCEAGRRDSEKERASLQHERERGLQQGRERSVFDSREPLK